MTHSSDWQKKKWHPPDTASAAGASKMCSRPKPLNVIFELFSKHFPFNGKPPKEVLFYIQACCTHYIIVGLPTKYPESCSRLYLYQEEWKSNLLLSRLSLASQLISIFPIIDVHFFPLSWRIQLLHSDLIWRWRSSQRHSYSSYDWVDSQISTIWA